MVGFGFLLCVVFVCWLVVECFLKLFLMVILVIGLIYFFGNVVVVVGFGWCGWFGGWFGGGGVVLVGGFVVGVVVWWVCGFLKF